MSLIGPHAVNSPTFRTIAARLASLTPPIKLREHLVDNPRAVVDLEVHPLILQGVDFTVKDPDRFLNCIRSATAGGQRVFGEGSTRPSDWKQHWAMTASLLATKGIGFREPWRYELSGLGTQLVNARPQIRGEPAWDDRFAGNFAAGNTINLSALHISVAFGKWTECNVHIDETGIAMVDMDGNLSITPNAPPHLFNELLLKTMLPELLKSALGVTVPTWFIDRVNLQVLGPDVGYDKLGVSVDVLKGKTYKLTLTASCGLTSCSDIDVSKIIKFDTSSLEALKAVNPTISFTKRF